MFAGFTFTLADASYNIQRDEHDWRARCSAKFVNTFANDLLRTDITFLNSIPTEITIKLRTDGSLNRSMLVDGLDEQVAQWRKAGFPCDSDAYLLQYWPKSKDLPALLGMTTMLTEAKFLRFHDFMVRHIGRDDLTVRIGCRFHGFREPHYEAAMLPTKEAFLLNGQHYFMPDETTIIIDPSWLATGLHA